MRYSLPAFALAALMLSACSQMPARPVGPPPGGPNDPVPPEYLRGTEFDRPDMIRFSWGMEDHPANNDRPGVDWTWAQIRQRLATYNR